MGVKDGAIGVCIHAVPFDEVWRGVNEGLLFRRRFSLGLAIGRLPRAELLRQRVRDEGLVLNGFEQGVSRVDGEAEGFPLAVSLHREGLGQFAAVRQFESGLPEALRLAVAPNKLHTGNAAAVVGAPQAAEFAHAECGHPRQLRVAPGDRGGQRLLQAAAADVVEGFIVVLASPPEGNGPAPDAGLGLDAEDGVEPERFQRCSQSMIFRSTTVRRLNHPAGVAGQHPSSPPSDRRCGWISRSAMRVARRRGLLREEALRGGFVLLGDEAYVAGGGKLERAAGHALLNTPKTHPTV